MKKALKSILVAATLACFSIVTLGPGGWIAASKGLSTVEYIIILCLVTPTTVEVSCDVHMHESDMAATATVEVVHSSGTVVYSGTVPDAGGTYKVKLRKSDLAPGTYTCTARVNGRVTDTKTFDI